MLISFILAATFFSSFLPSLSFAADEAAPLEITADKALEWNQSTKTYIARGNAIAKQADMSVKADILTATYGGTNNSTSDITLLEATGNVTLTTTTDTAKGDKAVYDLLSGKATLSGHRPKITHGGTDTIEADEITVWTKNNVFDHAEATGNVIINNGAQTAISNKAAYTPSTSIVVLSGAVKISQGQNWLQGDTANINLATHVSTMAGQGGTGRIKGVFYPGATKQGAAQ